MITSPAIYLFNIHLPAKIWNIIFNNAHQGCVYLIKKNGKKGCNFEKYYYNLKQLFSI